MPIWTKHTSLVMKSYILYCHFYAKIMNETKHVFIVSYRFIVNVSGPIV